MEAQVLKDARFTMVSQQLHYAAQPFPLITTGATNNQTQLVGGKYIFVCALQEEMWIFTSVYVHTEILFLVRTERGQIQYKMEDIEYFSFYTLRISITNTERPNGKTRAFLLEFAIPFSWYYEPQRKRIDSYCIFVYLPFKNTYYY